MLQILHVLHRAKKCQASSRTWWILKKKKKESHLSWNTSGQHISFLHYILLVHIFVNYLDKTILVENITLLLILCREIAPSKTLLHRIMTS